MDYPNEAGFKEHNGTSELAAYRIEASGKAQKLRGMVLDTFKVGDFTADEVAGLLREGVLSVRPRVSELFSSGFLEKTGLRRKNAYGSACAVFRLLPPETQGPTQRLPRREAP